MKSAESRTRKSRDEQLLALRDDVEMAHREHGRHESYDSILKRHRRHLRSGMNLRRQHQQQHQHQHRHRRQRKEPVDFTHDVRSTNRVTFGYGQENETSRAPSENLSPVVRLFAARARTVSEDERKAADL
jgi:hypothetical protein